MEHQLPDAGDVPVIEWSTTGGLGDPGGGAGADLRVWSDGRVEVGERFAGRPTEGSIEPSELQLLLAAAIEDHGFFELDAAAIDAAVDAARRRRAAKGSGGVEEIPLGPPFTDAGTSRIAIAADGRRHEVCRDGLFAAAREYPEVTALGDLRAIEERLVLLAQDIARTGGS
jgi:hypothetical protein